MSDLNWHNGHYGTNGQGLAWVWAIQTPCCSRRAWRTICGAAKCVPWVSRDEPLEADRRRLSYWLRPFSAAIDGSLLTMRDGRVAGGDVQRFERVGGI